MCANHGVSSSFLGFWAVPRHLLGEFLRQVPGGFWAGAWVGSKVVLRQILGNFQEVP